jgi:hypothetical protein
MVAIQPQPDEGHGAEAEQINHYLLQHGVARSVKL